MGAISVTIRIYDSAGNLLRQMNGGAASAAVGALSLGHEPWDPSQGALAITGGAWSSSYDGKDSQGAYLASGSYLIEVESAGSGTQQKSFKKFTVLRTRPEMVSAYAWPNPAGKNISFVTVSWTPSTQEIEGRIYNQAGELMLDWGLLRGGQIRWELKNAASGVYFVALRIPGERQPRMIKLAVTR